MLLLAQHSVSSSDDTGDTGDVRLRVVAAVTVISALQWCSNHSVRHNVYATIALASLSGHNKI